MPAILCTPNCQRESCKQALQGEEEEAGMHRDIITRSGKERGAKWREMYQQAGAVGRAASCN